MEKGKKFLTKYFIGSFVFTISFGLFLMYENETKAQIVAGRTTAGWDGWIKLSGNLRNSTVSYETKLGPRDRTLGVTPFSGYAWGAQMVGWISFNSSDCDINRNNFVDTSCGGNDNASTPIFPYRVYTNIDLSPPPPRVFISVDPTTPLPFGGGSTRISWRSENSISCEGIEGTAGWRSYVGDPTGYYETSITASTRFGVRCLNAEGESAIDFVLVGVCASRGGCSSAPPICGNDTCESGETFRSCSRDCRIPIIYRDI